MEDGHTVPRCEKCHQANETVDIRPSDMMLCQPCCLDKDTYSIDGEKQQISKQELETEQTTITSQQRHIYKMSAILNPCLKHKVASKKLIQKETVKMVVCSVRAKTCVLNAISVS